MDLIKVRQQSAGATASSSTPVANSRRAVAATLAPRCLSTSTSTTGMLRTIVVQEGVHGLYRGVTSPLLAVTPAFAISFWSCDLAKSFLLEYESSKRGGMTVSRDDLSIAQIAIAGGFSGIPLACVVGPSERIKCLMQVDKLKYSGFADCARQLYREGGFKSIFRGTGSAVLRDVPGNAAYFASYEFLKRQSCAFEQRDIPSTPSILLAGGCAGVANWVVAIPFDVIKSRWQTAPAGKYRNLVDVLRQTVQQEGASALFRGLTPALLRAFPSNAACLLGVETARAFFAR
jgi:solute carrier family 25 carnitine/acylcarnitine transporter 20/29